MTRIAIIYYSKNGATQSIAKAVACGIESENVKCTLYQINPSCITEGRFDDEQLWPLLEESDAIVFGSPTYMGSAPAQFKAFMDASSSAYVEQVWNGKLAAGFTCGGSLNGEQQQTLLSFFALACQQGMLWAGVDTSQHTDQRNLNRTGSSIGLVASYADDGSETIHPNDIATARYFGSRLAQLVK